MIKMDKRYALRDQVSKEDREFMQKLYRRAAKPKEQLDIICDLFPYHTKKQIKVVLGLERETKAPERQKEYNDMKKVIKGFDEETKAAAVRAILLDGEKVTTVAERYGVSDQTVYNWVKRAKKTQQQFMDYAEKTEKEMAEEKDAEPEDKEIDWQRLKKVSTERSMEQELTGETAAEPFPYSHFIPLSQCDEPAVEKQEAVAETVFEYVDGEKKPAVDEKEIKAAAFDVITYRMTKYPCSNTGTMMRFIQGVQALANQLCEVE